MSAQLEQYILGVADTARQGNEGAKRGTSAATSFNKLRRAVIISEDTGFYEVAVIGNNGGTVDTLVGVRGWGDSTFAAGDKVFLAWLDNNPIPFILSSGSGGSGAVYIGGLITFFS